MRRFLPVLLLCFATVSGAQDGIWLWRLGASARQNNEIVSSGGAAPWWETNAVLAVSYDTGFVDDTGIQSLVSQSASPTVITNANTNVIFKADQNFLWFTDTAFTPGLNPLTVSMWVYMTNVTANTCLFDMGTNVLRSRYYMYHYDLGGGRHILPGTGGAGSNFDTGTNLIANTWYHIVSILHGSTNTLYIDGHLERVTTGAVNDGYGRGNRTFIGNYVDTNYAGFGYLDEFQVITGVVTLVDAGRIYTNSLSRHAGNP